MTNKLELYLHIPFCVRKCAYCDFLSAPQDAETIERYVQALTAEIETYRTLSGGYRVETIFFGGGTPSLLSGEQMKKICRALREVFDISDEAEISMEANPGTVTMEKLSAYREAGINRISFGLQSANDEELKLLGRIHTFDQFEKSYEMARKSGFDNINVDLISAIPKQTLKSWEETLEKVLLLQPEHISAYSLIIEEGTPFAERYGEDKDNELPSEEEERRMYRRTKERLQQAGYHRYEISNYAREGKECRHNLGYWERCNYLGIGLGASSLLEEVRYSHIDNLESYLAHAGEREWIEENREALSCEEQREEFVFLGLRKMKGISEREFSEHFGADISDYYGKNLEKLKRQGLLEQENGYIRLTEQGIDISNYVFAELLCE